MIFNRQSIEALLEGDWYREPKDDWQVDNIVASHAQAREDYQNQHQSLFVAMNHDTWRRHTNESGKWNDTHPTTLYAAQYINGVIATEPIPQLNDAIPQFIVSDTYEALNTLAHTVYNDFDATLIATTGSRGVKTINTLLKELLIENDHTIVTKQYDHTSVALLTALASANRNTEYVISEATYEALTANQSHQFAHYVPDTAIFSMVEANNNQTEDEVAAGYYRLINTMFVDSNVILNSDSPAFEKLYQMIDSDKLNVVTYGFTPNSDVFVLRHKQVGDYAQVKANVLGENADFQTKLKETEDIRHILGALAILKVSYIPLYMAVGYIKSFIPLEERQQVAQYTTHKGALYNMVETDSAPTMDGIVEAFQQLQNQTTYTEGRTLAIIGSVADLSDDNKAAQYQALAEEIIQADIDLVWGYGEDAALYLKHLPEKKVVGHYQSIDQLAQSVAHILENGDHVLIKGNVHSEDWYGLQDRIIKYAGQPPVIPDVEIPLPHSTGYGAATFNMSTGQKVAQYGNQRVTQNQGAGNLLIIHRILNLLFAKKLHRSQTFTPDNQSIEASKIKNAIPLEAGDEVELDDILSAAIINGAPNALTMLANTVLGSGENSLNMVKGMVQALGLNASVAENITGRHSRAVEQKVTLGNLFVIGKLLFTNYPAVRDMLSRSSYTFKNSTYKARTNLFDYGLISHGLFYGEENSIGIVRSKFNGETYITITIGARSAFHRDAMIYRSLSQVLDFDIKRPRIENIRKIKYEPYKINILGDTYFGESYVDVTEDQALQTLLTSRTPDYSFEKIRPILEKSDFNICNFEAPIFDIENTYLQQRLSNVRRANEKGTLETLKQENIDLITLASPHTMDSDDEGLHRTLELLEAHDIHAIGAAHQQKDAEKPFVIYVNNQRYMIFNAHAYQSENYYTYNRYAIGSERGIACFNPFMYEQMSVAKREDPTTKIIVIAHWGSESNSEFSLTRQRIQAKRLSEAGADIIIGHGARHMQGIEQLDKTTILYDIGSGVFNGEDNSRDSIQSPYSLIPQLNIHPDHTLSLRLYPIYTNNHETSWQPRFVDDEEFKHCYTLLKKHGALPELNAKKDDYFYFDVPLN
ncbi:UDP-N-acetylmuramoylalanyl-D-glutamyl-2,6-diaminopimelate--D-alanyl-D-alanine ligase [Staphylococcus petrasii]|uniref:UDP-N-acetylmuramoylalanyl-D-glutamyl-2,6-diamino pimelate--D-alanyl-D-alanine ligase n=1 Tax=Staphylococcus petrasii TaxID=1276936 RepID=A0A380G3J4_9STAP|nr:CapA family protein [Staphylococcus petrasii]PNZ28252.1 hypothetical protein CD137_07365 [Staphylococcus petrasii]TGE12867.1 hypothetical protein E2557_02825 [Staphylococcus petrasii]SUM45046.1 UDP-N-acetylmuramoylalanyl-D-glutamyl-2,6-diaminopimelate--D-alanyl-D-alanine ligase [Staphylococcus petrasii]